MQRFMGTENNLFFDLNVAENKRLSVCRTKPHLLPQACFLYNRNIPEVLL